MAHNDTTASSTLAIPTYKKLTNIFGRFKNIPYICKRNGQNDITDVFIIKLV